MKKHIKYWLALKFPFLRNRLLNDMEKERLAMAEFRANMGFFGYDINECSDRDIKQGYVKLAELWRSAGITKDELMEQMEKLNINLDN